MKIAVLAVQGAFIEHEKKLETLGAECFELRQKKDLNTGFDGLVLPGGESTVQGKLLRELDMFDTLKDKIEGGMPVLGTCAGLILLADQLTMMTTCILVHFRFLCVAMPTEDSWEVSIPCRNLPESGRFP